MPRAVHPHVRAQDQAAAEDDQVMLARRLALLDDAAGDRCVDVDAIEMRVSDLELRHRVTREHAVHRLRGAEDGVAFGHINQPSAFSLRPSVGQSIR